MTRTYSLIGLAVALLLTLPASGAVTNAVPWSESFETYTNGTAIAGTNGWTGQTADAGIVTNWLSVTNYPSGGRSYPLAGSHTNVLAIGAEVANQVQGVTGGVVKVDFLVKPTWSDTPPTGNTNRQYMICVLSNGLVTIWHWNRTAGSNEWRTLSASPVVGTNDWSRFTIMHDYSNSLFSVAVNEAAPIQDAAGWTTGGASANGPWFYMVQTNRVLSALLAEAAPAYLDDFAVTRRALAWSGAAVTESVTNDGSINNASPITVTLADDTFTGTVGSDLVAAGKVSVAGLPSNLTAVVQVASATQVVVTVTNRALVHESGNSTAMTLQFANTAFTLGNAWDVTGMQTNVTLTFLDTPVLSWSTNHFAETVANNGSLDNSSPCLVTLANGTFAGAVNEEFATNSAKLVVTGLPAGLTAEAIVLSATEVRIRFPGNAVSHDVANDVSNVVLAFQDGAFNTVPASSVFVASTNFSISYIDPSVLTYGATTFAETVANNGALSGTTLTLANKSFNATNGEDLVGAGKVQVSNLPAGLGLQVLRGVTDQDATLVFTGTATSHAAANGISNLGIEFLDGAFAGGNAAGVANYLKTTLQITFNDPRVLAYSGTTFTEIAGGAIDNRSPVTITLSGDTLTGANGDDFVGAGKITVANLPAGLTAQITRDTATRLSVQLAGTATANAPGDSVSNVSITFNNGAFTVGNAVYVGNYQQTGISVNFITDAGFYNVLPYREPFEGYASGTLLAGTNGWSADVNIAGVVTGSPALTASLLAYETGALLLPLVTNHVQVLSLQDTLQNEIHSESFTNLYVDFMAIPVAMQEAPVNDTNQQYAFYVTTNLQLAVWQRTHGTSANEWLILSNAPAMSTSQWMRFTIQHDYVHGMFQMMVNQAPVSDPRGWTAGGITATGSWYYMVQTNGCLTSLKFTGNGNGFVDDFTVLTSEPVTLNPPVGSFYLIR